MNMMLRRYHGGKDSSGGLLFVNGEFFCYTCEDQRQDVKVAGETRIPPGIYEIKFRDAGGLNEKYRERYPEHVGMLHLQDVPGFEWIYIHTGNNDAHTEGCVLVGYGAQVTDGEITVQRSREAYRELYQLCKLAVFERGETIRIHVID